MKGATAEPCVRMIRVPHSNKTMMIGSSQNFLRSFIKAHNSSTNSPMELSSGFPLSELSRHVRGGPRALRDTVALCTGLVSKPHWIVAAKSLDQSHRRQDPVKYHAQ